MTAPHVLQHPTDRPPREERLGTGTTLSLLAHAALVSALVWGVHWRTKPTAEGSSAELWAAVPQISAPPPTEAPVPPPPPALAPAPARAPAPAPEPAPAPVPKPPDIVSEQEKERKLKQQQQQQQQAEAAQKAAEKAAQDKARADAQKQQQLDQQKQAQADQQKLAKLRQEQLDRVMGQLGAPPDSTGKDARNAGPSASYLGRIVAQLKRNLLLTDDVQGDPVVDVDIRCAPDGTIISRRIVKSSGSQAWDDAVLRAIDRTQTLPRDVDGKTPAVIPLRWNRQD